MPMSTEMSQAPGVESGTSLQRNGKTKKHAKGVSVLTASAMIEPQDLEDFREIASGSFGKICEEFHSLLSGVVGLHTPSSSCSTNTDVADYLGTDVAVKEFVKIPEQSMQDFEKYFERELQALRDCRHPNVVQFIGIVRCWPSQQESRDNGPPVHSTSPSSPETPTTPTARTGFSAVTEYVAGGNLRAWLEPKPDDESRKHFPWRLRVSFAIDSARACAYLASRNIIHRDLKPENLLLTENGRVKVADFGFARPQPTNEDEKRRLSFCGTDAYMSPEVMLSMPFDGSTDIFSYGVILCELLSRKSSLSHTFRRRVPGFCLDPEEIRSYAHPDNEEAAPEDFVELAVACTSDEPSNRPSWKEILRRLKEMEVEVLRDHRKEALSIAVQARGSQERAVGELRRSATHIGLPSLSDDSRPSLSSLRDHPLVDSVESVHSEGGNTDKSLQPQQTENAPTLSTLERAAGLRSSRANTMRDESSSQQSPSSAATLTAVPSPSWTLMAASKISSSPRRAISYAIPHRFTLKRSLTGLKCQECHFKVGFGKQFLECDDCGFVCHKPCAIKTEPVCGLNFGMIKSLMEASVDRQRQVP